MSGKITTLRAETKAATELHKIIRRNATEAILIQAKCDLIRGRFQSSGQYYRITEIYIDEIKRLIAVGKLEGE